MNVPDSWDDDWSQVADTSQGAEEASTAGPPTKPGKKTSKAQRRAQQAEFNKQFWAEAEAPQETNYFLESRNVVPLRQDFKAPPVLLSRRGPIVQSSRPALTQAMNHMTIEKRHNESSSEDEDDAEAHRKKLAERQAQAAKEREEKQRKYEERRLELFGPQPSSSAASLSSGPNHSSHSHNTRPPTTANQSGTSSPGSATPPHSRSSTPQRGRRGRGRGGAGFGAGAQAHNPHSNSHHQPQARGPQREMFDSAYLAKPDSIYVARRKQSSPMNASTDDIQPIRLPRGPDGSGRGGFGFAPRGG